MKIRSFQVFGWFVLLTVSTVWSGELKFRHHFADAELPADAWGQTALADLDGDGCLEFITGRRGGDIRYYKLRKNKTWSYRILGKKSPSDVGGAVLDVNGDGHPDFVTGGAWYEHPGDLSVTPWPKHVFDPKLSGIHDVIIADIDSDGRGDVVTMSDRNDLRWYKIPAKPAQPWKHTPIFQPVHAGLAAADLDRDGDIDIVRSEIWLENIDKGQTWREHKFCGIPWADRKEQSFFYKASRSCVADINRDGRLDIIISEAEFSGARIAWFECPNDPYTVPWKVHILPMPDGDPRGPWHSLQTADFDNDGDVDIFSGEMEFFGVPPHRWYIWENVSGDGLRFKERVILDAGLGTHEAQAGDIDGDGDIDLIGKLWRPVKDNTNQGRNHVDFLENLLVQPSP